MSTRDHHRFFAKSLIPKQVFQSPDRVFAELTGPKRDAFLMFLWQEAGKLSPPALPASDVVKGPGGSHVARLDVVGVVRADGQEVVVVSLPPAVQPNEALFLALARGPQGVSVFYLERCMDTGGTGISETDAVLAQVRADGTRINHGFQAGLGLDAFKARLAQVLRISLDGLEDSLAPVDLSAYVAGGRAPGGARPGAGASAGASAGAIGVGALLEKLLLVRAALPLVMYLLGSALPSLVAPLWPLLRIVFPLLAASCIILLIVWLYQVHAAYRGKAAFSPGMAAGGWFIPIAHLFLPPLIVRSAWRAVLGRGGGWLALLWWLLYLLEVILQSLRSVGFHIAVGPPGGTSHLVVSGQSMPLPESLAGPLMTLVSYSGLTTSVAAYALLWYIVRRINLRV